MSSGIKDIAVLAGVHPSTVSNIINRDQADLYRVETQDSVRRAARELGYRPVRSARALRACKTGVIGFVAPNMWTDGMLGNYGVYPFIVGMSHHCTSLGCHVAHVEISPMAAAAGNDPAQILREQFFDGLVINHGRPPSLMALLAEFDTPVVWWDAGVFDPVGCIFRDEKQVGRDLTKRLIDLGHRKIAYMVGNTAWRAYQDGRPPHYSYAQRYEAFCEEMGANGLKPAIIRGYDQVSVASQIRETAATAVIASDRYHVLQVMAAAATHLDLRTPEDLSVATVDLDPRLSISGVEVAGMLYDRYQAGRQAASMLLAMVEQSGKPVPSVVLPGVFEPGGTVGPPPRDGEGK